MSAGAEIAAAETKAKSSTFYAGMKVLPPAERAGMFAIYALCRALDDIADEQGIDPADRRSALDGWRTDIAALYAGGEGGRDLGARAHRALPAPRPTRRSLAASISRPTVSSLVWCTRSERGSHRSSRRVRLSASRWIAATS